MRIKEIRTYLGRPRRPWSQEELARELGIDERTVRRREQRGDLSAEEAARLARLARCDVEWLLTGQGRLPGQVEGITAFHPSAKPTVTAVREAPISHRTRISGAVSKAWGMLANHLADLVRHGVLREELHSLQGIQAIYKSLNLVAVTLAGYGYKELAEQLVEEAARLLAEKEDLLP